MSIPADLAAHLAAFPAALRALIEAELAAGNSVIEVAHCFLAPPVGAYVKLEKNISTRPRETSGEFTFHEQSNSSYSGEWTDAKRFFFVLEPPRPAEPEPNMDLIRENQMRPAVEAEASLLVEFNQTRVEQFRSSMVIDYEKWHDGIGYDLTLLTEMTGEERNEFETLLLARADRDWRDVEALAALQTARATEALKRAFAEGDAVIRDAVLRYAPAIVSEAEETAHLVAAIGQARFYAGLTQTLDRVARFHPPRVVAALWRAVREREGEVAGHLAALLMFIHGRAAAPFDWNHRPFFLQIGATEPGPERERLIGELEANIGEARVT